MQAAASRVRRSNLRGRLRPYSMALACAGAFLAVYGVYFAVTYLGARKLARE